MPTRLNLHEANYTLERLAQYFNLSGLDLMQFVEEERAPIPAISLVSSDGKRGFVLMKYLYDDARDVMALVQDDTRSGRVILRGSFIDTVKRLAGYEWRKPEVANNG